MRIDVDSKNEMPRSVTLTELIKDCANRQPTKQARIAMRERTVEALIRAICALNSPSSHSGPEK